MAIDLFGEAPDAPIITKSCRAVGPQGGKHYVMPRGYAAMPGTGPEGKRCWDCAHYTHKGGTAGSYPKCALMQRAWTGGRATDILARSPACSKFELRVEAERGGEG